MTKKKLTTPEIIYDHLKDAGLKPGTAEAFRDLYSHVEFKTPISKKLLDKFTRCGIYFPKEHKIRDPEDGFGVTMHAMVFAGLLKMKCPNTGLRYPTTLKEALSV